MAHPYSDLSDRNFWKKTVSKYNFSEIFSDEKGRFLISPEDKIGCAGSCFAQKITQLLNKIGRNKFEFEAPNPLLSDSESQELGYGKFSARYGNIYTARQLKQLIEEAFGLTKFSPKIGISSDSRYIDLKRPNINIVGFPSFNTAYADRQYHLQRVKKMFEEIDIFIFTLGLTESWVQSVDGDVFGIHPSVALGVDSEYSVSRVNFDYVETYNDMVAVINFLRSINSKIKFLITVSPVGLAATHQDNHVLLSNTYSKSVLRAVAGKLVENNSTIDYFPSFEIFSLAQSFGQFLSDDLREVNNRGVGLVMKLFQNMYFNKDKINILSNSSDNLIKENTKIKDQMDSECDELMNIYFNNN
jgi:hypothetical protein